MTNKDFEKLIKDYEKLVFTICNQMVKDYHEAQNLTQETFLSVYMHKDSCPMDSIKPWIARIATNKAKDYLKSAYNRKVLLESVKEDSVSIFDLQQSEDNITVMTENKEAMRSISEIIISLEEPYKFVSEMYFLQNKDVEQISIELNRPKKTIQTQIYRAKLILQKKLKGDMQ